MTNGTMFYITTIGIYAAIGLVMAWFWDGDVARQFKAMRASKTTKAWVTGSLSFLGVWLRDAVAGLAATLLMGNLVLIGITWKVSSLVADAVSPVPPPTPEDIARSNQQREQWRAGVMAEQERVKAEQQRQIAMKTAWSFATGEYAGMAANFCLYNEGHTAPGHSVAGEAIMALQRSHPEWPWDHCNFKIQMSCDMQLKCEPYGYP